MLNVLIVDDERLARSELKRLLADHQAHIQVVAEAANAAAAQQKLAELDIDLVFLDVQMPGVTGVELAQQIDSDIQFVFCTAYDQYAVDAFTLNAVDYLVKPVNPQRLAQCIQKIQSTSQHDADAAITDSQTHYLPEHHGLLLKFGDVNRIVKLAEIERFESIGNHCAVYSPLGKSWVHSSLSKVEARLDPRIFFKASRSELIRVDAIERIEPGIKTGTFVAVMQSGQMIDLSRRQAQSLKQLFSAF